jgi:hypothetical protein
MLRSKIQPTCKHSTVIDATHQDLLFKIPTFYHHWCYTKIFSSIFQHQLMLQFKIFSWKLSEHSTCTRDISRLIPKSNSAGTTKLSSPRYFWINRPPGPGAIFSHPNPWEMQGPEGNVAQGGNVASECGLREECGVPSNILKNCMYCMSCMSCMYCIYVCKAM